MTYYTIYKITNKLDGKYYIGKHKTKDLNDDYMGSGKLLKRAIKKYGKESFVKEILYIFETEEEANQKEKELVVVSEETYNLCEGGQGGFSYINENLPNGMLGKKQSDKQRRIISQYVLSHKEKYQSKQIKKKISASLKVLYSTKGSHWTGRTHKQETKNKIANVNKIKQAGSKNSQYGTCWVTNGQENKKIKKDDLDSWLKMGYKQGRLIL